MERLDKILANMGAGSRKEVKKLIKSGGVTVNGETVTDSDAKVDEKSDCIEVFGEEIIYKKYVYLMLNKPAGVISATEDNMHNTVIDLVPEEYLIYNLFPVGRLDIDTEGLLLLTNDGQFAHNIASPKKHLPKCYYAKTQKEVTAEEKQKFENGLDLGDFTTMPAKLEKAEDGYYVTISEGKFHQVKRMFEKIDNKVTFLKRIKIGNLALDESLMPGEMREITEEEEREIWK